MAKTQVKTQSKSSFLAAFGIVAGAAFLGLLAFYLAVFYYYNYSWVGRDCLDTQEVCAKNNDARVKTFLSLNSCKEFFEPKGNDFICGSGVDINAPQVSLQEPHPTNFRDVYTSKDGQLTSHEVPLVFSFGRQ
jgi:hypothetical protein